ncbi:MAG: hypothetical protein KJP08_06015 [Gammaproteobacteria bacterium]|nr:hypothetical protein [Gammaproteobacteria bacterium]NNF50528.1 hypothetical protein [Woeseiaceae bacterium]MBT8094345.1 hypothetical protein [Gammaproteobacteria bacterium]MBT8104418.1 hypothetical protein [Gammaproteobacteria bacterium]NNK24434.1 hypothetical protein [Woeseiaceae bacterium]
MSAEHIAMLACGLCIGGVTIAADEEAVDTAFLEYLGEWEEADDDWLLFEDVELAAASEQDESAEEEAESPEREDES